MDPRRRLFVHPRARSLDASAKRHRVSAFFAVASASLFAASIFSFLAPPRPRRTRRRRGASASSLAVAASTPASSSVPAVSPPRRAASAIRGRASRPRDRLRRSLRAPLVGGSRRVSPTCATGTWYPGASASSAPSSRESAMPITVIRRRGGVVPSPRRRSAVPSRFEGDGRRAESVSSESIVVTWCNAPPCARFAISATATAFGTARPVAVIVTTREVDAPVSDCKTVRSRVGTRGGGGGRRVRWASGWRAPHCNTRASAEPREGS